MELRNFFGAPEKKKLVKGEDILTNSISQKRSHGSGQNKVVDFQSHQSVFVLRVLSLQGYEDEKGCRVPLATAIALPSSDVQASACQLSPVLYPYFITPNFFPWGSHFLLMEATYFSPSVCTLILKPRDFLQR